MSGGRISGKRAIITGAGMGIGRATALLFAREGARVGLIYALPCLGRGVLCDGCTLGLRWRHVGFLSCNETSMAVPIAHVNRSVATVTLARVSQGVCTGPPG